MTAPVPVRDLYWSKFLLAAGVAVLGQVCIGVLYLLSGQLAGVSGGLPLQLAGWMFFGALGGMAVCAVQLFLSLVIRSFAPPVALGLVGGIAGACGPITPTSPWRWDPLCWPAGSASPSFPS